MASGQSDPKVDQNGTVVAFATKVGSLYYLEYCRKDKVNVTNSNKEQLWHRRYEPLSNRFFKSL